MTTTRSLEDDVIRLLSARRGGDAAAHRALFELLYAELRGMARRRLAQERADHTLAPTSLVHEVFVRLAAARVGCADRDEFLRLAALVMRRVLVDSARRRRRRRAGEAERSGVRAPASQDDQILRLDGALTRLGRCDPALLRVVELRFLAGLRVEEAAAVLGVSTATVKRDWRTARAFLQCEIVRAEGTR